MTVERRAQLEALAKETWGQIDCHYIHGFDVDVDHEDAKRAILDALLRSEASHAPEGQETKP